MPEPVAWARAFWVSINLLKALASDLASVFCAFGIPAACTLDCEGLLLVISGIISFDLPFPFDIPFLAPTTFPPPDKVVGCSETAFMVGLAGVADGLSLTMDLTASGSLGRARLASAFTCCLGSLFEILIVSELVKAFSDCMPCLPGTTRGVHACAIFAYSSSNAKRQPPPSSQDQEDIPTFRLPIHASPSFKVMSTHHSPPTLILTCSIFAGRPSDLEGTPVSVPVLVLNELSWAAKRSRSFNLDIKESVLERTGRW
jgi:hypothetical protein